MAFQAESGFISGMSSTTIKVEDPLLRDLKAILPAGETLSSYVRSVLEKEIRRRQMLQAATAYREFLREHPQEQSELEAWEETPLEKHRKGTRK